MIYLTDQPTSEESHKRSISLAAFFYPLALEKERDELRDKTSHLSLLSERLRSELMILR